MAFAASLMDIPVKYRSFTRFAACASSAASASSASCTARISSSLAVTSMSESVSAACSAPPPRKTAPGFPSFSVPGPAASTPHAPARSPGSSCRGIHLPCDSPPTVAVHGTPAAAIPPPWPAELVARFCVVEYSWPGLTQVGIASLFTAASPICIGNGNGVGRSAWSGVLQAAVDPIRETALFRSGRHPW